MLTTRVAIAVFVLCFVLQCHCQTTLGIRL